MNSLTGRSAKRVLVSAILLITPWTVSAQDSSQPVPSPNPPHEPADLSAVIKSLEQVQAEVKSLHAEMKDLRAQQQSSELRAQELEKQLSVAKVQLAALGAPAPSERNLQADNLSGPAATGASPGTPGTATSSESTSIVDRVSKLEENQQMTDAKLADHNQTKVESGSKYRVRLSGLVLFNLFGNQGTVENIDFPQIATSQNFLYNDHSIGGSLRQSQFELQAFGPTIAGARTSADIQFDFAGGFPLQQNGTTFGIMRLRTGTVRFDWENTSFIGGQDTLFISPLTATTLATIATPALSYSGNLWAWTPQIRLEHSFKVSDSTTVKVQGGLLDPWSGDLPASEYFRTPTWGENSGVPATAARIAVTRQLGSQNVVFGVGGYYSRQDWGFDRSIDSWVGTLDLTIPFGSRIEFTGQFFRGSALGGIGGGIGQSVLWNGSLADPTVRLHALDAVGGWAQLKFRATPKWQFNGAFGQDNPFAGELRQYNGNPIYNDGSYSKNQTFLGNFIYQPRSDLMLSFEYRRIWTYRLDLGPNTANVLNLGLGYKF